MTMKKYFGNKSYFGFIWLSVVDHIQLNILLQRFPCITLVNYLRSDHLCNSAVKGLRCHERECTRTHIFQVVASLAWNWGWHSNTIVTPRYSRASGFFPFPLPPSYHHWSYVSLTPRPTHIWCVQINLLNWKYFDNKAIFWVLFHWK